MISTKKSSLFIISIVLFMSVKGFASEINNDTTRLLFLGSSSTYYHDMPYQVANMLTDHAGIKAEADLVGRSGTGVHIYLRPDFKAEYGLEKGQTVLDKIRDGNYDYVILQIPTDYLAGQAGNDSDEFDQAIDIYCKAIKKTGAKPVLYEQGWGEGELFNKGDKMIRAAAVRNDISIIPCRTAWKIVRRHHPMIELHDLPDTVHPGRIGTYLNLCCFYAGLTGKSPEGLALNEVKRWPFFKTDEGKRKRNRDQYDYYQPNAHLTQYLQKVAWQAWFQIQNDLNGN